MAGRGIICLCGMFQGIRCYPIREDDVLSSLNHSPSFFLVPVEATADRIHFYGPMCRLRFLNDEFGHFVALATTAGCVEIFNIDNRENHHVASCRGETAQRGIQLGDIKGMTCCVPSEDGPKIVCGDWGDVCTRRSTRSDSHLFVFDAGTGSSVATIRYPGATQSLLCVSEWDRVVFQGQTSTRSSVNALDLSRMTFKYRLKCNPPMGDIFGLAADVSRNCLFSASSDAVVRLWDYRTQQCESSLPLGDAFGVAARCCHFADDLNLLLVGTYGGSVQSWDVRMKKRLSEIGGLIRCLAIDRVDEEHFVAGTLLLWNKRTMRGTRRRSVIITGISVFNSDWRAFTGKEQQERLSFLLQKMGTSFFRVSLSHGSLSALLSLLISL